MTPSFAAFRATAVVAKPAWGFTEVALDTQEQVQLGIRNEELLHWLVDAVQGCAQLDPLPVFTIADASNFIAVAHR